MTAPAERLHAALRWSPVVYDILTRAAALGLPNYYVGAGCIAQTVWNRDMGNPPLHGISDVDIVYHDGAHLGWEAEDAAVKRAAALFAEVPLEIDVKNQARVHLWYKKRFGKAIPPYQSAESAIATWPTTATAVGVRLEGGALTVCAPFGLEDLFSHTVRANKAQITQDVYLKKCERWVKFWPSLTIVPW